jgi:anti-anti-sigma factor
MTADVEAKARAIADVPVVELRLAGPVTAAGASRLKAAIRRSIANRHVRLVVDLRAVTAIDVTGIAGLLDAHRAIASGGAGTMVLKVNAIVRRALRESGTVAVFHLADGQAM